MSLVLFIFYWVGIPLFIILAVRGLWRRSRTSFHKGLVAVVSAMVFLGLLWLAEGEKWLLDHQVRELCAKDGGIKVYETVKLPPTLVDDHGVIRTPIKEHSKASDDYFYESSMRYLRSGNPEMWQLHFKIYRRVDNKLLGETINYARRGGDVPGPWHESSFGCPENADVSDLEKQVFSKGK